MYVANHMLRYNGKSYAAGEVVPLTEREAADLLKARVVKIADNGTPEIAAEDDSAPAEGDTSGDDEAAPSGEDEATSGYTAEVLETLTKAELVALAKEEFGLPLNMKFSETNLISAILAAQEGR